MARRLASISRTNWPHGVGNARTGWSLAPSLHLETCLLVWTPFKWNVFLRQRCKRTCYVAVTGKKPSK